VTDDYIARKVAVAARIYFIHL